MAASALAIVIIIDIVVEGLTIVVAIIVYGRVCEVIHGIRETVLLLWLLMILM